MIVEGEELGFLVVDAKHGHEIRFASSSVEENTGPVEGRGMRILDLMPGFPVERVERARTSTPITSFCRLRSVNGYDIEARVAAIPHFSRAGALDFYMVLVELNDIMFVQPRPAAN